MTDLPRENRMCCLSAIGEELIKEVVLDYKRKKVEKEK